MIGCTIPHSGNDGNIRLLPEGMTMKKSVQLMIDVPHGREYGFPQVFPQDYPGSTIGWLVNQRYPIELLGGDAKKIRFFWKTT